MECRDHKPEMNDKFCYLGTTPTNGFVSSQNGVHKPGANDGIALEIKLEVTEGS